MITNERKEIICQKYNDYLQIIYKLGNKMMLQKHLILLAMQLNVAKNKTEVLNAIKELEENEIIKRINFAGTSNKFIIFKKYAIRYINGAKKSSDVAAMKTFNTNTPYSVNIFRVHIIINLYMQSLNQQSRSSTLEDLLLLIEQTNSSILLNKNDGLDYYLNNLSKFKQFLNLEEFNYDVVRLTKETELRKLILNPSNREFLTDYMNNSSEEFKNSLTDSIATLLRKGVYIKQMYFSDCLHVDLMIFDVTNSQKSDKLIESVSTAYKVFKRLFDCPIKITYTIYAWDNIAKENFKKELTTKKLNPFTKVAIDTKLNLLFKKYGLSEINLRDIKVSIQTLEFELNYLDGKKILNLTNNKSYKK